MSKNPYIYRVWKIKQYILFDIGGVYSLLPKQEIHTAKEFLMTHGSKEKERNIKRYFGEDTKNQTLNAKWGHLRGACFRWHDTG